MPREEKGSQTGSYGKTSASSSEGEGTSSLAARRARLRGSLSRASYTKTNAESSAAASETQETSQQEEQKSDPAEPPANDPSSSPNKLGESASATTANLQQASLSPLPQVGETAIEFLSNIDQALNACATNLAALQKLSAEQTEVLKGLTTTLQNQTLFEIGLNLNSLTESLAAALEPMKAIGELVPAMDGLITAMEGKEVDSPEKLSTHQLVTSLADQLSAGVIDSWTFKCAYMAVYPTDHPADLLHRLVELLGTQRLSGELFRAAYEAVQVAEPPQNKQVYVDANADLHAAYGSNYAEQIQAQFKALQTANEELRQHQEKREKELSELLEAKESELQRAQELLDIKYDEFNSRYDVVTTALNQREEEFRELLESKDMELIEKESEINLLKAQMEELRAQTEEMARDMQKQIAELKIFNEAPSVSATASLNKPQSNESFFDNAPTSARSLFDTSQLPKPSPSISAESDSLVKAPQPTSQQASPQPVVQQPPTPQPTPKPQQGPSSTPFSSNTGSYGSGVRAQVFEVIVRQALAGAPWREICAGPMQVNNIAPEEVETEVRRRQALLNK